ncbi:MAG: hypothetical protein HQ568_09230 [Calditrichaeota bacterium]|nr:hypothetical protein [Calditrichota bacterium]
MDDNVVPSTGQISEGIEVNNSVLRVIEFVYRLLPEWRDNPCRDNKQIEDDLNSQLCKFLNLKARDSNYVMIIFHHEERQTDNRKVDISVVPADSRFLDIPLLVFECKRLPAPRRDREMEYITGHDKIKGGIQRFKRSDHGAKLKIVAMIGYIQKDSIDHWYGRINEWILELSNGKSTDDLDWSEDEILHLKESSVDTAKYQSEHVRVTSDSRNKITIFHLWIVMNN